MTALRIRSLHIYALAIPMRLRFEHAAASRDTADPIVLQLGAAAPYAQYAGHGETLARTYVTGESSGSVVEDIANLFAPRLAAFAPESFAEALEFIEALPTQLGGRIVTAARAAVELALLDLAGKAFRRHATDVVGWLGLPAFGPPGALPTVRCSGFVVGRTRRQVTALLRIQRLYRLRDFKLKVAVPGWRERLEWAHAVLRRAIDRGRATLRVDANGGWTPAEARAAWPILQEHGVCALEQPMGESCDDELPALAAEPGCELFVDESLITEQDAQRLIARGGVRGFNIRLAKNGGLMPALRIARQALSAGLDVQFGCLVGETSILSAAGIAFLQACPAVRFVEAAYAPWLLKRDVVRRPVRFGLGGRLRPRTGFGLGVQVEPSALEQLAAAIKTVHL